MARDAARFSPERAAIGTVGSALVAASLVLVPFVSASDSHFAGPGAIAVLMSVAGVAVLAVGLLLLVSRPWWQSGTLAVAAACLWFAPVWIAWDGGPAIVRTIGMVATIFTPVVLAHLLFGFPDGVPDARWARRVIALGYGVAAAEAIIVALFYDPFRDVSCWANCTDNALLVASAPRLAEGVMLGGSVVAAVILSSAFGFSLGRSDTPLDLGPRLVAALSAAALAGASVVALIVEMAGGTGAPVEPRSTIAAVASAGGVVLLASALGWTLVAAMRRRLALDEVARRSTVGGASTIEQALGVAVGDPALTVVYWLPESRRFVDAGGQEVSAPIAGGTEPTLAAGGRPVAVIRRSVAAPDLERELGPALVVALENESLRVEAHAQLAELRAAQGRIVAAGDARRRELERALHDGAQQRLTVLALRLRSLADDARAAGEPCAGELDEAVVVAREALDELRRVAHGIHPTVLENEGLPDALSTLATHARIPVQLAGIAAQRAPAPIEVTAYLFVSEAVEDALRRGASYAIVHVDVDGSVEVPTMVVSVADDGRTMPVTADRILDRVGAVGGEIATEPGLTRAELPCVS